MFSRRFERLANKLSGKVVPPEWMVDTVVDFDELDTAIKAARDSHPMRHCDFMKMGTHGGCIANCFHLRLKRPGVMVDCVGIESNSAKSFRGKLSGEVRLFERKTVDIS